MAHGATCTYCLQCKMGNSTLYTRLGSTCLKGYAACRQGCIARYPSKNIGEDQGDRRPGRAQIQQIDEEVSRVCS